MTVTIPAWAFQWLPVVALLAAPFVYSAFREPRHSWDFQLDTALITLICWALAAGFLLGRLVAWLV